MLKINAEVAHSAVHLCLPEEKLGRTQFPGLPLDLRDLGQAHEMGATSARFETERRDPATNDPRILPGSQVRAAVKPAGPQEL
jgi:hypothetical protein